MDSVETVSVKVLDCKLFPYIFVTFIFLWRSSPNRT